MLHAVGLMAMVLRPGLLLPVLVLLFLDHAVLMACGLWPRSRALGPNRTSFASRSGTVALTFDDGPDPQQTPGVLDLLARHGQRATFFLIGERAARHPDLVARIRAEGHEVGNHTHTHPYWFCVYPPWRLRREIDRCQRELALPCAGDAPRWFRAPAGLRNAFLDGVLRRLGLELVSWSRRGFDTAREDPERLREALLRDLRPGEILLLHDSGSAIAPSGKPVALEVLPELLAGLAERGLRSVTLSEAVAPPAAP